MIKLSANDYTPHKFTGGQAYLKVESQGYIVYSKTKKKVYTHYPERVINTIKDNKHIMKALGIEALFEYNSNMFDTIKIPKRSEEAILRLKEERKTFQEDFTRSYYIHDEDVDYKSSVYTVNNLDTKIFAHKVVLKAILTGRCTKRDNAFRRFYKVSYGVNMGFKDCLALTTILDIWVLRDFLLLTTNLPNLLKFIRTRWLELSLKDQDMVKDLISMSLTVRAKINFAWSNKRMEAEHDALTKVIITERCKNAPLKQVVYAVQPPIIDGIEVMTTSRELIEESSTMKHCIGTASGYGDKMLEFGNLLIRYNRNGVRATAQLYINDKDRYDGKLLTLSQFSSRGNASPPKTAYDDIQVIIKELTESDFGMYLKEKKEELRITKESKKVKSGEFGPGVEDLIDEAVGVW